MPDLFEGPEKKLEIILRRSDPTLREDRDSHWARVAEASGAAVISRMAGEKIDAYLLSESSLFVWDDRILMITCGSTNLIDAVPAILSSVGPGNVAMVFYERRRLMFPSVQPETADFEAEVARLSQWFGGRSYRLGPANQDHVHVFFAVQAPMRPSGDMTLELLMAGLAPERKALFDPGRADSHANQAALSRLDRLLPGVRTDKHLFRPRGYSLNATQADTYYTVHVTPQSRGSYASFECNLVQDNPPDLVARLIDLFLPDRFCMVITSSLDLRRFSHPDRFGVPLQGYTVTEASHYEFDCGYSIRFVNLIRSQCGAPDFSQCLGGMV